MISDWLKRPGKAVISVVHDLSLAKACGTGVLLMDRGRCVARGSVSEVLAPERLEQVYRMDVYAWMRGLLSQWS